MKAFEDSLGPVCILIAGEVEGIAGLIDSAFFKHLTHSFRAVGNEVVLGDYGKAVLPDGCLRETLMVIEGLGGSRFQIIPKEAGSECIRAFHSLWMLLGSEGGKTGDSGEMMGRVPVFRVFTSKDLTVDHGWSLEPTGSVGTGIIKANQDPGRPLCPHGPAFPGIVGLVEATAGTLPENSRAVFAKIQKPSVRLKVEAAEAVVKRTSRMCDECMLLWEESGFIQVATRVLAEISWCFGLELSTAFLALARVSSFCEFRAGVSERAVIESLLRTIQGVPNGGNNPAVSSSIAGFAATLGEAYTRAIASLMNWGLLSSSAAAISREFRRQLEISHIGGTAPVRIPVSEKEGSEGHYTRRMRNESF